MLSALRKGPNAPACAAVTPSIPPTTHRRYHYPATTVRTLRPADGGGR